MSAGKMANNAFLGDSRFCPLGLIVDRIMDNQESSHLDEEEGGLVVKDRTRKIEHQQILHILLLTLSFYALGIEQSYSFADTA